MDILNFHKIHVYMHLNCSMNPDKNKENEVYEKERYDQLCSLRNCFSALYEE